MAQTVDQTPVHPSYPCLGLRVLLAIAVGGAGLAKFAGFEIQVAIFKMMGHSLWLIWVTAVLTVAAAMVLLIPSIVILDALIAAAIGAGAAASRVLFIGDSWVPATILFLLACLGPGWSAPVTEPVCRSIPANVYSLLHPCSIDLAHGNQRSPT